MGDFNSLLVDDEKLGGLAPDQESKMDLSNFINKISFLDVDLSSGAFTQSNKRIGMDCIQVWLDRALISPNQLHSFSCKLSVLPRVGSNHSPISLSVVSIEPRRNFPFQFEKMWTSHPDLQNKICYWWGVEVEGIAMFSVAKKLTNVKQMIKVQNKIDFGHIFQDKEELFFKLSSIQDTIQQDGYNDLNRNVEISILTSLENIISKEEKFWK